MFTKIDNIVAKKIKKYTSVATHTKIDYTHFRNVSDKNYLHAKHTSWSKIIVML